MTGVILPPPPNHPYHVDLVACFDLGSCLAPLTYLLLPDCPHILILAKPDHSVLLLDPIWTGQAKIQSRYNPAHLCLEMIMIEPTIGDTPYPYFL